MYASFGAERVEDYDYEAWMKRTSMDDIRRAKMVNDMLSALSAVEILDFGCGNGGFLRNLRKYNLQKYSCCGVELKKIARDYMNQEGISCKRLISEYNGEKFDVITMFHVIEHLTQPVKMLKSIDSYLKDNGLLVIETPNAEDALLSRYHCEAFADFTYWSEHVYNYTSKTLAQVVKMAGYEIIDNTQIQRYSLTNHMYWLAKGKPGGHTILAEYDHPEIEKIYGEMLKEKGQCDTLYLVAKKGELS